jgi:hypothetical protein
VVEGGMADLVVEGDKVGPVVEGDNVDVLGIAYQYCALIIHVLNYTSFLLRIFFVFARAFVFYIGDQRFFFAY